MSNASHLQIPLIPLIPATYILEGRLVKYNSNSLLTYGWHDTILSYGLKKRDLHSPNSRPIPLCLYPPNGIWILVCNIFTSSFSFSKSFRSMVVTIFLAYSLYDKYWPIQYLFEKFIRMGMCIVEKIMGRVDLIATYQLSKH